ncbi:hypothetical protein CUJ84_Chr000877 [Rhizobium leguminosarum]|uniref:Uncharacterized protein n=1 Tax=Rhizobium leguminosarum TaxID=384 RepID=A0A2K9YZ57_RHILE|nr:hypothetical protein CUJ84_Chr000877 [Rhizobium leguminosarum]
MQPPPGFHSPSFGISKRGTDGLKNWMHGETLSQPKRARAKDPFAGRNAEVSSSTIVVSRASSP